MRMNIWVSGQGRQYRHVYATNHATQRQLVYTNVLGGKIYMSLMHQHVKNHPRKLFLIFIFFNIRYISLMTGSVIFDGENVDSLPFKSA